MQEVENTKEKSNLSSPYRGAGGLRIVFMGTPEFAVASLEALVKAKCNIVGAVSYTHLTLPTIYSV